MIKMNWEEIQELSIGETDPQKLSKAQLMALQADFVSCLMMIWAQTQSHEYYESEVEVTVPAGESTICLEDAVVDKVVDVCGKEVPLLVHHVTRVSFHTPEGDCVLVSEEDVVCADPSECPEDSHLPDKWGSMKSCVNQPSSYEEKSEKLFFNRRFCQDTKVRICFLRKPDCTIYEMKVVAGIEAKDYFYPDIPPEMLMVLRDHIKARFFSESLDWANASAQFQLADRGFDAMQAAMQKPEKTDQRVTEVVKVVCLDGVSNVCMCRDICTCVLQKRPSVEPVHPQCWADGPKDADIQRTHEWSIRKQGL